MIETPVIIHNKKGIHVRPSGIIYKALLGYPGEIVVNKNGFITSIKDIISILTLGLAHNDQFILSVNGPDEEEMLNTLKELFEKDFDFDEL